MSSPPPEPDHDLDALAAGLRADSADMRAFLPALAVRLEEAFPDRCDVKRKRKGMLSSERVVESVGVTFGDVVYRLGYEGKRVSPAGSRWCAGSRSAPTRCRWRRGSPSWWRSSAPSLQTDRGRPDRAERSCWKANAKPNKRRCMSYDRSSLEGVPDDAKGGCSEQGRPLPPTSR